MDKEKEDCPDPTLISYYRAWKGSIWTGDFNSACKIELDAYNSCIKPKESLSAWNEWQELTLKQRILLANYYCAAFPSGRQVGNGRLAIVLHNYSGLAHEVQLGRQVRRLLKDSTQFAVHIIYAFGAPNGAEAASAIYGVSKDNIIFLCAKGYTDAAVRLEGMATRLKAGTILYPTAAFFCFWMSLICRHSNQKFLQMKYYPRQAGRISEWAGGDNGSPNGLRFVNGEAFTALPVNINDLPKLQLNKRSINSKAYIGSISRVEKIQDPTYVQFILELLDKYEGVYYLVTGRVESRSAIPRGLSQHPRVIFVGWVDPQVFLSKIDVYIDPWPQGGGDMSFLALHNGIPYLTLATKEGELNGPLGTIRHIAGSSIHSQLLSQCLPMTREGLRSIFDAIITSSKIREAVGCAWQQASAEAFSESDGKWRQFLFQ